MTMLTKYILRQMALPFLIFTVGLAIMFILAESLGMLDMVINRRQSATTFFLIIVYILPGLLTIIIPFALFCSALFALNRLSTDSELMVMWSAGVSNWAVSAPVMAVAAAATIITLILNLYLMPAGYRAMREKVYEIRADIASAMIQSGSFTHPSRGLTVYNRTTGQDGSLYNLLIHDNRKRNTPTTYMAEVGQFLRTPEGPRLVMVNGNVQQISEDGELSILYFDKYTFDLSEFAGAGKRPSLREAAERYLHELLDPVIVDPRDQKKLGSFLAEGHSRLAAPLYNLAFAMIALCAILLGGFNRRSNWGRIGIALAVGLPIRLLGFGLQSMAASTPQLLIYQYLLPIYVIFSCAFLLFGPQFSLSLRSTSVSKAGTSLSE